MVVEIGYYTKQVDEKPNLQKEAFDTEAYKRVVELIKQPRPGQSHIIL